MGINAKIVIEFNKPASIKIVKKLQYAILQRLESIEINDDGYFILPDCWNDNTWDSKDYGFARIELGRYYSKNYTRGSPIEYCIMMLILVRSDYVKNVYYVADEQYLGDEDNSGLLYTEERILGLLKDFVDFGFETPEDKLKRENSHNPTCPFCEEKMTSRSSNTENEVANFECFGCESTASLTGKDFSNFQSGLEYTYSEVIDMRRKKIYDAQGKFLRPL